MAQAPLAQVPVALAGEQAAPHEPQSLTLVSDASHPSARLLLQSAHPVAHEPVHVPVVQLVVWHTLPQAPQLSGTLVLASQPSVSLSRLQSSQPTSQAPEQALAVQVGVGTWLPEQAAPQPPQLAALVAMLVSQPSARLFALQSPQPASHAPMQVLAAQTGLGTWLAEQPAPQAPQFGALVARSVSQPSSSLSSLQSPQPDWQAPEHAAAVQATADTWLAEQVAPQPPQLDALVVVVVSQPFALFPSQSP